MSILGNIIWFIFGGIIIFIGYIVSSFFLFITIIGIPFGLQIFNIAMMALFPFGKRTIQRPHTEECLYTATNILWIITGGIWIALTHLFFGIILFITILGIPFAKQHFKLASLALTPFGKDIISA